MSNEFMLDFGFDDCEDQQSKTYQVIEQGYYLANVKSIVNAKTKNEKAVISILFEIVNGKHAGFELEHIYFKPDYSDIEKDAKKKNNFFNFATRAFFETTEAYEKCKENPKFPIAKQLPVDLRQYINKQVMINVINDSFQSKKDGVDETLADGSPKLFFNNKVKMFGVDFKEKYKDTFDENNKFSDDYIAYQAKYKLLNAKPETETAINNSTDVPKF